MCVCEGKGREFSCLCLVGWKTPSSLIPRGWIIVFLLVLATNSAECYSQSVVDFNISLVVVFVVVDNISNMCLVQFCS